VTALSRATAKRIVGMGLPGYGEDEVGFMCETVEIVQPDRIFDWGTNVGASARIFYEACIVHCIVETIDLPAVLEQLDRDHAGGRTGSHLTPEIRTHRGDGVTEALRLCAAWEPKRPLFFLDGNHLRENVFREIWSIHKFCPRGVLLIHDTNQQPGDAVRNWQHRYGGYRLDVLNSQAGMVRMIPL
jgi:hypothetical protein